MIKKFLSLVCFFIATTAFSQDIIVKNDKTEIKAKVLEISETTIMYKKFEMLDGPSYSIKKADVFMIMYQNGTKEYMANATSKPTPPAPVKVSVGEVKQSSSGTSTKRKNVLAFQLSALNTNASIEDIRTNSVVRLRAGLVFRIPIANKLAIEPSINVVGKATSYAYTLSSSNVEGSINTSFLELPIAIVYTSNSTKGLLLGAAPTFSFNIAQSQKAIEKDIITGNRFEFAGSPNFSTFEFGGMLMAGYKLSPKFNISLIYNKSFTNISTYLSSYTTNYIGLNTAISF